MTGNEVQAIGGCQDGVNMCSAMVRRLYIEVCIDAGRGSDGFYRWKLVMARGAARAKL
jgi:hypothetical protein